MNNRRTSTLIGYLIALFAMLASCAPAAPMEPAAPEVGEIAGEAVAETSELIVAVAQDTASLDPACTSPINQTASIVYKAIYQTLVTYAAEPPYAIEPDLAASWEFSDDFMQLTFKLREGATFISGNQVTAKDVVASIGRVQRGLPFMAESIGSVEAIGDLTVTMNLNYPDPAILSKLAAGTFSILDSSIAVSEPCTEPQVNPLAGSGPYSIEEWQQGNRIVLVRNDLYQEDPDRYDRVVISYIPNGGEQAGLLEMGEIDIALDLPVGTVGNSVIDVSEESTLHLTFLEANAKYTEVDPIVGQFVADENFQAAIRYALNYPLIRDLIGGASIIPGSFVPVGLNEALSEGVQYDPEEAKKRLSESGYDPETEIPLTYYAPDQDDKMLAEIIESNLEEAGVNVSLDPRDGPLMQAKPYALRLNNYRPWYLDSDDSLVFLPGGGIADRNGWINEELANLRAEARITTDMAKREKLFRQAQFRTNEIGPYAFVIQPGVQIGFDSSMTGVNYHPQYTVQVAKVKAKVNCDKCKTWCSQNRCGKKCKQCAPSCPGVTSC